MRAIFWAHIPSLLAVRHAHLVCSVYALSDVLIRGSHIGFSFGFSFKGAFAALIGMLSGMLNGVLLGVLICGSHFGFSFCVLFWVLS